VSAPTPLQGEAGPPSRRWLMVYNCTHVGLQNCLGLFNPGLHVDALDFGAFEKRFDEFAPKLEHYDRIITAPHFASNACIDFTQVAPVTRLPLTAFEAYHPDLCYMTVDGDVLRGPLFDYHSKIVTAAWLEGLPVSVVRGLFNGAHYERFGFLGIWDTCKSVYLGSYAEAGVDLAPRFPGWTREGAFMHSVNHPSIRVVADIARALLAQDGLVARETDFLPHDNLKNAPVWPVYPEIAETLGVRGSLLFKIHNAYRFLELDEFIAASYELLSRYPRDKVKVFPMYERSMTRIQECL
jgi:hypothetical protein